MRRCRRPSAAQQTAEERADDSVVVLCRELTEEVIAVVLYATMAQERAGDAAFGLGGEVAEADCAVALGATVTWRPTSTTAVRHAMRSVSKECRFHVSRYASAALLSMRSRACSRWGSRRGLVELFSSHASQGVDVMRLCSAGALTRHRLPSLRYSLPLISPYSPVRYLRLLRSGSLGHQE